MGCCYSEFHALCVFVYTCIIIIVIIIIIIIIIIIKSLF